MRTQGRWNLTTAGPRSNTVDQHGSFSPSLPQLGYYFQSNTGGVSIQISTHRLDQMQEKKKKRNEGCVSRVLVQVCGQ